MRKVAFEQAIEQICARDTRYQADAYLFVRDALDHTYRTFVKPKREPRPVPGREGLETVAAATCRAPVREGNHVSGHELLSGIRELALSRFGPMAMLVFEHWGVRVCEDFGEMVFNLVDQGVLGTTSRDSRTDFAGGYDFFEAFRVPFLPPSRQPLARALPAPAPSAPA